MEEEEPNLSFWVIFVRSLKTFISFFNLHARFRRKFPKKGSLNWVIKVGGELALTGHEIAIKEGKLTLFLKTGTYTENVALNKNTGISAINIHLHGSGGGGGISSFQSRV